MMNSEAETTAPAQTQTSSSAGKKAMNGRIQSSKNFPIQTT